MTQLMTDYVPVEMSFYRECGHGEYKRRVSLPIELAGPSTLETACPACGVHMLVLTQQVPSL